MEPVIEPTSGGKSASGTPDENPNPTSGGEGNTAFEKLLREKKNTSEKNKQLEAELKAIKDREMLEKENYKDLLKKRDDELADLKTKVDEFDRVKKQASINSSLRAELTNLGADPKHIETALQLVRKDKLIIDQDTGVVVGAVEAAKDFYTKNSELGFFTKKTPGANHNSPSGDPSTPEEAYISDLRKCKTDFEINAVMKKYNKI